MRLNLDGLTFPTICFSRIFHVSQRFFFLRIHRNRRFTASLSGLDAACDVFKLGVPIGVLFSFNRLSVRLQAVTLGLEQCSDFRAANDKALVLQFVGQDTGALASPP